jgi:myosin heavy subunit
MQDEMENIKVEKIGWQIDKLKNQADALSDALSMKNAKGVAVVSSDYQQLIDNANEQRRNLLNQNAEYLSQQRGMDVNSKAYQDLQSKIESNLKTMRSLDSSTVQWSKDIKNIPVQKLGWDLDKLKDISDQLSDSLNLKELKGIEVVDRDYNNLINNANERRNLLLKQNAEYISQQKGMDKYSEAYQELEGKIRSTQEELRQLDESTIKWKKDMASLKVQKLSWQLDELNAAIDRINNRKSLNETQGYDIASDVYQSLIENSMRRIELLKQENQLLQNQQVGMDKNSTAYQELQKQIVDNINEIDSIKISQEEWNDNIIDTGIKNIQKYRDSLSKSNDQLQRQKDLQQAIQELEKADSQRKVRTYVEGQGFVYQRDEDEFREAQENLEDVIKDQLLGKIDDLIDALEESKKDTNVYDKNGNLLGSVYNTPQLGNLADLLTRYYANNNNATLDIDLLKNAFGKNIVSNINPQNSQTSFSIGDIVINEVKDGNELARTIVDQFPNALLQALYSKQ